MRVLWFVTASHVMQSVAAVTAAGYSVELIVAKWLVESASNDDPNITVHYLDSMAELPVMVDRLLSQSTFDTVVASWPDAMIDQLAPIFQHHDVPYIGQNAAKILTCKRNYNNLWRSMRIPTPLIYHSQQQVQVPCVVKPRRGQAGYGVRLVTDDNDAKTCVGDSDKLVQQFVAGHVVSFMGSVYTGQIDIDMCYDIESDALPYFPETGLIYPSQHSRIIPMVKKHLETFCSALDLDCIPFTLDILVSEHKDFYFLDFAPRLSINGQLLMYHSGEHNYVVKLLQRFQGQSVTIAPEQAVIFRQLGLTPGNIESIQCDCDHLVDKLVLPSKVGVALNDDAVQHNGYAIASASDIQLAEEKWSTCVSAIQVSYSSH